jgi:hypothetical protein
MSILAAAELSKFTRVGKIDVGRGINLQSAQTMYPDYADSCQPNMQERYPQADPVGRREPTSESNRNLCDHRMQKYDVETNARPELIYGSLKEEHEDTLLGDNIHSLVQGLGVSRQLDVRPTYTNFQALLDDYASSNRQVDSYNYYPTLPSY